MDTVAKPKDFKSEELYDFLKDETPYSHYEYVKSLLDQMHPDEERNVTNDFRAYKLFVVVLTDFKTLVDMEKMSNEEFTRYTLDTMYIMFGRMDPDRALENAAYKIRQKLHEPNFWYPSQHLYKRGERLP